MPINFVTGFPGAKKTAWTILTVKARGEKEKRPVYACNIKDMRVPGWHSFDHPDQWIDPQIIPDGAIVVVDELQDFWGNVKGNVPEPILELSKHRHRGLDFYFITQDPSLVHATPRKLCNGHFYISSVFGSGASMVYEFNHMQLYPEKAKPLQTSAFVVDKQVFEWYTSTTINTVKTKIPRKAFILPIALLVFLGTAWLGYKMLFRTVDKAKASGSSVAAAASGALPGIPGAAGAPADNHPLTAAEYVKVRQPRIEGIEHTAPVYDDLTKPTRAPYPAACLIKGDTCKCYTQDATPYRTTKSLCTQIAKNGVFLDFDIQRQQQTQPQARHQITPAASAPAPASPAPAAPASTALASSGQMQEWQVGLNAPTPIPRHSVLIK